MLIDAVRGLRLLVAAAEAQGAGGARVLPAAALGLDCGETRAGGNPLPALVWEEVPTQMGSV